MSRVVIVGIGTRGDVAPLTGIACRLQDDGHQVVLAAHALFADMITGCGLRFRLQDARHTEATVLLIPGCTGARSEISTDTSAGRARPYP